MVKTLLSALFSVVRCISSNIVYSEKLGMWLATYTQELKMGRRMRAQTLGIARFKGKKNLSHNHQKRVHREGRS